MMIPIIKPETTRHGKLSLCEVSDLVEKLSKTIVIRTHLDTNIVLCITFKLNLPAYFHHLQLNLTNTFS